MDQELSATLDGESVIVGGYLNLHNVTRRSTLGEKTLNTRTGNPNNNNVVEIKGRQS